MTYAPDIDEKLVDRLAVHSVNELHIEIQRHASLTVTVVRTHVFASDIEGSSSDLRSQDTGKAVKLEAVFVGNAGVKRSRLYVCRTSD